MAGNLNFIQILTENFMVETAATINLGAANLPVKPVSTSFGGDALQGVIPWAVRTGVRALKTDLSYYSGAAFIANVDLGEAKRSTNLVLVASDTDTTTITTDYQGVIECNTARSFPSSLDAQNSYTPDDVFFLRRVSPSVFYVNLPRNISYRYYRIKLFDPDGTSGGITINDIFLGDSVDIDRAPSKGITHQLVDASQPYISESGRKYFLRRSKYQTISSIDLPLLKRWQVSSLKIWSDTIGISDPFWVILDPDGNWDGPVYGASFGLYRLRSMPNFVHQFTDYWSCRLSLEEAL